MDAYLARTAAVQLVHDALFLSVSDRVKQFIRNLPLLPKDQIPVEDNCPICLVPFIEILNDLDEVTADEPEGESSNEKGVTRLDVCGHIFCRRDLAEWIRTYHGNCPTCRSQFVPPNITLPNPYAEDDASSDGGEYLPTPEEEDDDDIDVDYTLSSEAEYWAPDLGGDGHYESEPEPELDSIGFVHEEIGEHEAMVEGGGGGILSVFDLDSGEEVVGEVEEGDVIWSIHDTDLAGGGQGDSFHHYDEDAIFESESCTGSEEEELEVEWGLNDGESIGSAAPALGEDESY